MFTHERLMYTTVYTRLKINLHGAESKAVALNLVQYDLPLLEEMQKKYCTMCCIFPDNLGPNYERLGKNLPYRIRRDGRQDEKDQNMSSGLHLM